MARKYVTEGGHTYNSLSELMECDHVIRVHSDGTITEPSDIHGPEVYWLDGTHHVDQKTGDGWTLMSGYGTHSGPVMHASEFIGGSMETDIIGMPGLYVFTVVEDTECDVSCEEDCNGDHEPAGWVVAYKEEEGI